MTEQFKTSHLGGEEDTLIDGNASPCTTGQATFFSEACTECSYLHRCLKRLDNLVRLETADLITTQYTHEN